MTTSFDPDRSNESRQWIEEMTGKRFPSESFHESLKSGVLLCELVNKVKPGTISKINSGGMPFVQMENIAAYINGCKAIGLEDRNNFMTVDLFEAKNLVQVVQNILTLKRTVGHGFEKQSKDQIKISGRDQTTQLKGQEDLHSRDVRDVTHSNDISRTGSALMSGRHENTEAFKCPVCTQFITSGAVNALGQSWHPNCFTCKKCGVKLATSKYFEDSGKAYCDRCILIVRPSGVKGVTVDRGFKFGN